MKKYIFAAVVMFAPFIAMAGGQVEVYPIIENSHGGNLYAKDLYTKVVYDSGALQQSQTGVPTYDLGNASGSTTDYAVSATAPFPYSYTIDENCSGTVSDGVLKVCNIYWKDDATAQNNPVTILPQVVSGGGGSPAVSAAPASSVQASAPVIAATTTVATTTDQQQLIDLQAQYIDLLKQYIALLEKLLKM